MQGAAQILDYNGIVYYSSTVGKPVIDFYRELGLTSWSLVRLRGFDGRGFLNALSSVRYEGMRQEKPYDIPYGYSLKEEKTVDGKTYLLYETDNVLPLGYTYDKTITLEEFEKIPTIFRQEVMLQAAVIDNDTVFSAMQTSAADDLDKGELQVHAVKIPITDIKCENGMEFDGKTIRVLQKDATLTVYFDGLDQCETYFNLENLHMNNSDKRWMYLKSDSESYNVSYYYHGDNQTYTTDQKDYIMNMGYSEEGKTFVSLRFISPCTLTVDEISIYCQKMDVLPEYVKERSKDVLEDIRLDVNTISGTIAAQKDELLILSIPYDAGWSAYIDGEKTEIYRGNIMYMGIPVKEGEHTITLKYELPGIRISIGLTLASIIIMIGLLVVTRKKRKISNVK